MPALVSQLVEKTFAAVIGVSHSGKTPIADIV